MNTLSENDLMNLYGGLPFNLPPHSPPQPAIDEAFWTQRAIWEYLYGS